MLLIFVFKTGMHIKKNDKIHANNLKVYLFLFTMALNEQFTNTETSQETDWKKRKSFIF